MEKIDFTLRNATKGDEAAIARLLHFTDPYIYPAICKDPEDPFWRRVVSLCLASEENVFSASHFRVLTAGDTVVALSCVIPCGKARESAEMDGFNLVNLCVDPAVRRQGAGRMLMELYVREYGDAVLHLDVVADNIGAIRLYQSCGFQIEREYEGFAGENATVSCYHMVRPSMGERP